MVERKCNQRPKPFVVGHYALDVLIHTVKGTYGTVNEPWHAEWNLSTAQACRLSYAGCLCSDLCFKAHAATERAAKERHRVTVTDSAPRSDKCPGAATCSTRTRLIISTQIGPQLIPQCFVFFVLFTVNTFNVNLNEMCFFYYITLDFLFFTISLDSRNTEVPTKFQPSADVESSSIVSSGKSVSWLTLKSILKLRCSFSQSIYMKSHSKGHCLHIPYPSCILDSSRTKYSHC